MDDIIEYLKIAKIEHSEKQTLIRSIHISTSQNIKAPMLQMLIILANAKHRFFKIVNNELIIY